MPTLRELLDTTWPLPAGEGPCRTWPLDPGCGCLPVAEPAAPPTGVPPVDLLEPEHRFAAEAATWVLWSLTAGRYGLCEQTVRPCPPPTPIPTHHAGPLGPRPVLYGGRWLNLGCGCPAPGPCGCSGVDELPLPGPVHWEPPAPGASPLVTVHIDGQVLPPEAWRFSPPDRLVRVDGQRWPTGQDLALPLDRPGTFGVTYWTGEPVPPLARRAMSVLTCEFYKACRGDSNCALPERLVRAVSREGVDYVLIDPLDMLNHGRTGIYEVDLFLSIANPGGQRSPSLVWSPDLPTHRLDPHGPPPPGHARPATRHHPW
ncbi:hypothetical protein [Saccharothrix sp. HUAS TT1]|uniref:hypothetical protein n=1 Tax=unclassified Saccharothrix TaxID=2593673 RepID=UPI00345C2AE7